MKTVSYNSHPSRKIIQQLEDYARTNWVPYMYREAWLRFDITMMHKTELIFSPEAEINRRGSFSISIVVHIGNRTYTVSQECHCAVDENLLEHIRYWLRCQCCTPQSEFINGYYFKKMPPSLT